MGRCSQHVLWGFPPLALVLMAAITGVGATPPPGTPPSGTPPPGRYLPTWASLDARPLPPWYDDAKLGVFLNWGVYSVPAYYSEWFWWWWKGAPVTSVVDFMKQNYPPGFTYADFAAQFKAEFYDPTEWVDIIKASGAQYVVASTKHHEGFTMWPSNVSWNWNAMDVGPRRDLIGELAVAVRNRSSLHFGLYHSLFEWFNPVYLQDKANRFKTQNFVKTKTMPELYDLVTQYKPDIVWSDGDWEASDTYWDSKQFLAWLYNDSPVRDQVVVNDRWGSGIKCKHGDFYTCADRYNPGTLQKHKWENAMTIDRKSWGYRREAKMADILSMDELVATLAETVSCGGNLLMNVGPTADGRITPVFEERLRQMGSWLQVNGEAIYGSKPWVHQNDTLTKGVWYTSKNTSAGTVVYAITLRWPQDTLTLGAPTPTSKTTVSLLGYQGAFTYSARPSGGMDVNLQGVAGGRRPCLWGWVFRLKQVVPAHAPRAVKWRGAPLVGPAEVNPVMAQLARP